MTPVLFLNAANSFLSWISLIFIVMKMANVVAWSWTVVSIPLMIQVALFLILVAIYVYRQLTMSPLERALLAYYKYITGKDL